MTFMLNSIGTWSEVTMTQELMIEIQSGVDVCYEEIEGMTLFVCRDVHMLYKMGAIEKVGNFDGL